MQIIPGSEALLCVALLLFGSFGLFGLFWITDSDAVHTSYRPEHATEKRDKEQT